MAAPPRGQEENNRAVEAGWGDVEVHLRDVVGREIGNGNLVVQPSFSGVEGEEGITAGEGVNGGDLRTAVQVRQEGCCPLGLVANFPRRMLNCLHVDIDVTCSQGVYELGEGLHAHIGVRDQILGGEQATQGEREWTPPGQEEDNRAIEAGRGDVEGYLRDVVGREIGNGNLISSAEFHWHRG